MHVDFDLSSERNSFTARTKPLTSVFVSDSVSAGLKAEAARPDGRQVAALTGNTSRLTCVEPTNPDGDSGAPCRWVAVPPGPRLHLDSCN